eukprot:gene5622-7764_t
MSNLVHLCNTMGEYEQYELVEPLYNDCLDKARITLGENHPHTLTCMNNLAVLYDKLGKYELAETFHKDCLDKRRDILGDDHLDTLLSMNNLGGLYYMMGKYDESKLLFSECYERSRRMNLDVNHPIRIQATKNINSLSMEIIN